MSFRRLAPALCLGLALTITGTFAAPAGTAIAATTEPVPAPAATVLTAKPSATRTYVDRRVTVTGKVTVLPGQARRVWLQGRQTNGTWSVYATSNVAPTGTYSVTVPTYAKGARAWRIHVPADRDLTAATGAAFTLTIVAKAVPKSSTFSLLMPDDNGTWSRWNPCQTIDYRVNPGATGALARARIADTKGAAYRLSRATGIRFVYRGTTTAVPAKKGSKYPSGTEMVIAWARPGTSSWMPKPKKGKRGAAGMGGALDLDPSYNTSGLPVWKINQAGVVLDSTLPLSGGFGYGPRYGWQGTRGQLLMHEMAHAAGLGHTGAKSQIMYPTMGRKPAVYGKGDLAGLRLIGKTQGCLSSTAPR